MMIHIPSLAIHLCCTALWQYLLWAKYQDEVCFFALYLLQRCLQLIGPWIGWFIHSFIQPAIDVLCNSHLLMRHVTVIYWCAVSQPFIDVIYWCAVSQSFVMCRVTAIYCCTAWWSAIDVLCHRQPLMYRVTDSHWCAVSQSAIDVPCHSQPLMCCVTVSHWWMAELKEAGFRYKWALFCRTSSAFPL